MRASQLATLIVDRISAIEPIDSEGEGDRFHGHAGTEPPLIVDRAFSVGFGLPVRNKDFLDPTEYVCQGAVAIAYSDGDAVMERMLDDSEQVAEVLHDLAGSEGAPDVISIDVDEGTIHPGPVNGTLFATRTFRVRYHRT